MATDRWGPTPLTLLSLLACTAGLSDGLGPVVAADMKACELVEGAPRGTCATSVLDTHRVDGATAEMVCRRLDYPETRDWCYEFSSRRPAPYASAEVCAEVRQQRPRESCFLSISERISIDAEDIAEVIASLERCGDMLDYCLYHIPQRRQDRYRDGGWDLAEAELTAVVDDVPAASESRSFGISVGRAGRNIGFGARVCELLGDRSRAWQSCLGALGVSPMNSPSGGSKERRPR